MLIDLTQDSAYLKIELAVVPKQVNLLWQALLSLLGQLSVNARSMCWRPSSHRLRRCKTRACGESWSVLAFLQRDKGVYGSLSLCKRLFFAHWWVQTFNDLDSSLQSLKALFHHAQSLVTACLVVVNHNFASVFVQRYFMLFLKLD